MNRDHKTQKKDKEKAITLYASGASMRQIQIECGKNATVERVKRWGIEKIKEQGSWKPTKLTKKERRKALNTFRKPKKRKTKKTAESWKKRVFASWADTPEQAAFRRSPAYQEWRIIVLERDKYTCQHCEQTGGRLVVHHVKTFKMHLELRLEPDNGIVLCNDCHEKLHLSRVKQPKILKIA
ncbi:MAG: HNH endonuclease [Thermodesulfovibrionales bacterium]|nr:HNH endonuclease [Thermodesulfovibrionales bacterium]